MAGVIVDDGVGITAAAAAGNVASLSCSHSHSPGTWVRHMLRRSSAISTTAPPVFSHSGRKSVPVPKLAWALISQAVVDPVERQPGGDRGDHRHHRPKNGDDRIHQGMGEADRIDSGLRGRDQEGDGGALGRALLA